MFKKIHSMGGVRGIIPEIFYFVLGSLSVDIYNIFYSMVLHIIRTDILRVA